MSLLRFAKHGTQRLVGAMCPELHGGHRRSQYFRGLFETQVFLLEELYAVR